MKQVIHIRTSHFIAKQTKSERVIYLPKDIQLEVMESDLQSSYVNSEICVLYIVTRYLMDIREDQPLKEFLLYPK